MPNPALGATSAKGSTAKGSGFQTSQYLTRERLHQIAGAMSQGDKEILRFVHDGRFVGGQQLVRVYWLTRDQESAAARAARRTLKRLVDLRVLATLPRRIGGMRTGSEGMIYHVGLAGRKLLAGRGIHGPDADAPGTLHLAHTLAKTELVVRLQEAARAGDLELIEVQQEPVCWRRFVGAGGARLVLKPDLFARLGARALEDRWMVEIDLGSESGRTLLRKAARYLEHYRSGREQHEHGVYPRVLWLVSERERCEQVEVVLGRLPTDGQRLFDVREFTNATEFLATEARS